MEIGGLLGLGAVAASAATLIGKVVGRPASEVAELLADHVRAWRVSNLVALAQKTEEKLRSRGINVGIQALPTSLGFAVIEAASREDDDEIQDLWANLLANNSDPGLEVHINKTVIEVVRQLAATDARLLAFLAGQGWDLHTAISGGFDGDRISNEMQLSSAETSIAINNLWRLGCLVQEQAGPQILDGAALRFAGPTTAAGVAYRPSPLGHVILKAVAP